jgi:lysylphosphatidylglycerol synthetase-like protein (DUF2156 family)
VLHGLVVLVMHGMVVVVVVVHGMLLVHGLVTVVLLIKNVSDVAMLNSLLIVVMSAKHASSVDRLVVLNSLVILVMPTAKASNVSSPTRTTYLAQSATNASSVNSQRGHCSQVWHTFTCQKSLKKIPKKAKCILAQSKDFGKPWGSVQTSSI